MGSLVFDRCYPVTTDAIDAFFSAKESVLTPDSVAWFEKVNSTWTIKRQTILGDGSLGTATTADAPVPSFPECDPFQTFNDGMTVGWLVAALLLMTWGINMIRRQIR